MEPGDEGDGGKISIFRPRRPEIAVSPFEQ